MDAETTEKKRLSVIRFCLVFCAIAFVVACLMTFFTSRAGELPVYIKAANRMWEGENIYRLGERKAFTYPPFFALFFIPLFQLPLTAIRVFWYFLNFSLLGTGIWLIIRQTRGVVTSDRQKKIAFGVMLGLISARFMISPFEYQSHDAIIFLLVTLTMLPRRSQDWLNGFFAGIATACKATPLLFLPVFSWQRRWLAAVVLVVSMVSASFLPDLLLPRQSGNSWVVRWYQVYVSRVEVGGSADADGAWAAWNVLNQSLAGTIYRLSHPAPMLNSSHRHIHFWHLDDGSIKLLTLSSQLLVVGLLCWCSWPRGSTLQQQADEPMRRLGETAMITTAMLLLSPMSSKQHFCTLFLPITYCAADYLYRSRDRWIGSTLIALFLLGTLGMKDLVGRPLADPQLAYGSLTLCAILCLLATARVLRMRRVAQATSGLKVETCREIPQTVAETRLAA